MNLRHNVLMLYSPQSFSFTLIGQYHFIGMVFAALYLERDLDLSHSDVKGEF